MTIISHKDGTYSLKGLNFDEIGYLNNALSSYANSIRDLKAKRQGRINCFALSAMNFAKRVSDNLIDIICG